MDGIVMEGREFVYVCSSTRIGVKIDLRYLNL